MPDRRPRPKWRIGWAVCVCLAAAAVSLCMALPSGGSQLRETPIVRAVQRARPSVVNIRGEKTLAVADSQSTLANAGQRVNGMGTGVVIDPRGYIVTNHHVVAGVREIQVTTAGGRRCTGRLLVHDPETDLAILKVEIPERLPMITIGTSSDLMPGETVVAVGNAYGYEHTVTRGIISALHRPVRVSDAQFYDDLIQTDASINPGNSGGPLLNIDGEMIGINVAVRAGAQGIGFAIPADKAIAVASRLLASCAAEKIWHGVKLAEDYAVPEGGLVVAAVEEGSPAARSGVRSGDLITAVDDRQIQRGLDFHRALVECKAGEKVQLAVRRGGDPITMQLTLADLPQDLKQTTNPAWDLLGLELKPIATKKFQQNYRTRYRGGLAVTAVRPGSPAAQQGIRHGDVLVGMHIWETVSLENVAYILKRADYTALKPLKFFILRDNQTLYGYLPVSTRTARRP